MQLDTRFVVNQTSLPMLFVAVTTVPHLCSTLQWLCYIRKMLIYVNHFSVNFGGDTMKFQEIHDVPWKCMKFHHRFSSAFQAVKFYNPGYTLSVRN